jgi:hypothetical protein
LHKLNPENGNEKFTPARDFPRRRWRPDVAVPPGPTIVTKWELDDAEHVALEERFGKGALPSKFFSVSKGYDNEKEYGLELNEQAAVDHLVAAAGLDEAERKPIQDATTLDAVRAGLEALAQATRAQAALLQQLRTEFDDGFGDAVQAALDEELPSFLYFDQYLTLEGEISVDALVQRKRSNALTNNDRIFEALLGLAGTSVEQVSALTTFEEFNAALRAVSNQITDQIFKYWTQNRHLDVELRLDQARPKDPAPFNSGFVFRTRIENRRHRADTSFSDRSTGFVWFFSFLVWFCRLRETAGKKLVILLDEPGLSLHARAQGDLLRYFREQLQPDYQVVYTTHSPFMVDPNNLLSARTVEDVVEKDRATGEEKLLGTKVGENIFSTDPDTVSPLQRALDYEMTQTLFVGRHTLLVEGASDFLYLKWFSRQLERAGKTGLDYRWTISIVGGVDRIPGFVSLFRGNRLHVAAVVDVHKEDRQRLQNARAALAEGHLVTLDTFADRTEADIEDVLGREFYIALVHKAYGYAPPAAPDRAAESGRCVTKEVAESFRTAPPGIEDYGHLAPAEYLFRCGDEGTQLRGFQTALDRIERVVAAINKLMSATA